jgi:hypothetical protein
VRRTLDLLLPSRPEQRRARLLTTLTIAVGAATIAATSSSGNGEVLAPNGSATLSGAEIAPGATTPDHHDALVPATERVVATSLSSAESVDRIGVIERLSEQQALPSLANDEVAADADVDGVDAEAENAPLAYTSADGEVVTPERIFAFLDGRNSPLATHAETFVAAGIAHDVDPRVVVAISIAESNGGKMKPTGTHNAWGWGGSGGPRGLRAWDSWEQSIDHYTERLGALYDTDNVDWEFASTYCPPNTQWWFDTVTWAIGQI